MATVPSPAAVPATPSTVQTRPVLPPLWASGALVATIIFAFITRSMLWSGVVLAGSLLLIALHFPALKHGRRIERQAVIAMLLILGLSLPLAAIRGETAIIHFVVAALMLGSAMLITRDPKTYMTISQWSLVATQSAVLLYLSQSGLANFPLERMIPASSSNGITSYLIVLQANYCLTRYAVLRKPALITAVVTVGICVVGYGRGSLLTSVGILAINLLSLVSLRNPARILTVLLLMIGSLTYVGVRYGKEIALFLEANTKISAGLVDSHREMQIREYVAQLDGVALLIGGEYRGTSIERRYNNNPHNSYIRAHHIFGLPYLLSVLIFPLLIMNGAIDAGRRLFALMMFAIILFRSTTEPILFPTMLDVFYFGACFVMASASLGRRGAAA